MCEAFRNGGWGMYPTLFFGLLTILAAFAYGRRPERALLGLSGSLGLLTLLAGTLGFVTGVIKTLMTIEKVPPEKRWIWLLGTGESLNNIGLALVLLIISALLVTFGAFRLALRRPSQR
jgi:hypothetical protein